MEREEYQRAFSWLEPSQEAVEAVMDPEARRENRREARREAHRRPRLGTVLIAAVLAVALLTGTVFAGTQFNWFSLGSGETYTNPVNTDPEAFGKAEKMPSEPQSLLRFDGVNAETYIGFRLPASYDTGKDSRNCWKLGDGLYRRYYRNPDPGDPASPLLTVEILSSDVSKLLTRYPTETVKEDRLNGFETVWVQVNGSTDGRTQYCLFQKNETLGCVAAIASTVDFADAEQAAMDMIYVDSGIPIPTGEELTRYGFQLGWVPENLELDDHQSLADRWYVANATLADPEQDLSEAWTSASLYCREDADTHTAVSVSIEDDLDRFEETNVFVHGELLKTGTLFGHEARMAWQDHGYTEIQVYFPEYRVQLTASLQTLEYDEETGWMVVDQPVADSWIELAERILENVEIIPVPIAEEAPADFSPFAVG